MKLPLALLLASLAAASAQTRKNVLLICVDDLKPNIGAYGDSVAKTPNIDRLASRGLLFESAYTNQALCSPSRNALLTGIRPSTLGIYDLATHFRLAAPEAVSLPQHFLGNGYRTEAVGKIYHTGQGNHDDEKAWSVPLLRSSGATYVLKENQPDPEQKKKAANSNKQARGTATESADVPDDTYADGKTALEIVSRLEAAKGRTDTPFFIGAGFVRPHLPFNAPKKYWDLYDRASLKLPAFRQAPKNAPALRTNGELASYKDTENANNLTEEKQLELLHGYYAAVSYADAQIGKVLDALDRLGLTENTVVVLWGDHGWHLGDHGLWAKMTNFEQAARIPFIISAPGITAPGGKTRSLVESVDLYPTLVELAGLPAPATKPKLEGTSLFPVLKNPQATVKDQVLHVVPQNGRLGRAIRTSTHRLVEWRKTGEPVETAEYELYDYIQDPAETENLAASQPELVARLREKLASYPEPKPQFKAAAATPATSGTSGGQDRAALFARKDKDNDGKLTREEFLANQSDPEAAVKRLPRFDKDGDGILTREEFINAGK